MNIGKMVAYAMINIMSEKRTNCSKVAKKAGTSHQLIYDIVNGKSANPTIQTISDFCCGAEITLSEFFRRKEFEK